MQTVFYKFSSIFFIFKQKLKKIKKKTKLKKCKNTPFQFSGLSGDSENKDGGWFILAYIRFLRYIG